MQHPLAMLPGRHRAASQGLVMVSELDPMSGRIVEALPGRPKKMCRTMTP